MKLLLGFVFLLLAGLGSWVVFRGNAPIQPVEIRAFVALWILFTLASIISAIITYNAVVTNSRFVMQLTQKLTALGTSIGRYTTSLNNLHTRLMQRLTSLEEVISALSTLVSTLKKTLGK